MEANDVILTKDMVGIRIGTIQNTAYGYYTTLLIHQDPRASMNVMDKLYPGWKRTHQEIGGLMFCTISVFDPKLKTWIDRQDVGTAGDFEQEKSKSTDSFKRAVVNFVPAFRALYNAPEIHIKLGADEVKEGKNGKLRCHTKFTITELNYDNDKQCFTALKIVDGNGEVRFDITQKQFKSTSIPAAKTTPLPAVPPRTTSNTKCEGCGQPITPRVAAFSMSKYKKHLCMDCQKNAIAA